jgi:hypothetical protein
LSIEFLDGQRMDLWVGSLDDPALLHPTEHFGVESRLAGWHAEDGRPSSRLDDNATIQQRWRSASGSGCGPA